ncbi:hypothetical protein VR7878_03351 [Vibrio ruber DSM 16370]|uniref:Uncharacterized protein n=1 Tax=Vibrio ruber (strain DSM 16370 / JCM 11486 / BCRC 17186 / CECT 7878 / LMG 23124 / VR1) TaxID=1123498 RepID=A0A1R4LRT4_VIBR1|nr:hypothetical protein [Vibrio ruber]SJN59312.1 hypothetical protein VR7878_03351 [Vibrio ruber DSM 16370]
MKKQLQLMMAGTILCMSMNTFAGESQEGYEDFPSTVDYFSSPSIDSKSGQKTSSSWKQMNGKGTGWYGVNGGINAVYGAGDTDRSIERFHYEKPSWGWATYKTTTKQMDGNGSKDYFCPNNSIITELYYEDSGDDSIEAFRCLEVAQHTVEGVGWKHVKYTGETYCPKGSYLSGMSYKDYGDDYVEQIYCSKLVKKNDN